MKLKYWRGGEASKEKLVNTSNHETPIDPFKKHLKFVNKMTDTKAKTTNVTKYPSAISAKIWRDYYEPKEKERQKNIDDKNKRKIEREQIKNRNSCQETKTNC